ncbi:Mitochondrial matrix iron chaperone [Coemansia sp. BCRC 34962]|nr:Mitochondrial matrix iron chaperone [Coemansia sp. BCRC 34962]
MSSLSDTVYYEKSSEALERLAESLEDIGDQMEIDDYDIEYSSGVLTLRLGAKGTYVLNKQPPNKQIWLSSPVSGPERYDFDLERGAWFFYYFDNVDTVSSMTSRLAKEGLDPVTDDVGETPAAKPDYGKLVGKNFGFSFMPGIRDSSLNELVRCIMHGGCDAVLKIAIPCDPDFCALVNKIVEDLEACLSVMALDKVRKNDLLDEWAMDIRAWAGLSAPTANIDHQHSDASQYGDDSEPAVWEASKIAPCFESLVLFVAHHIKMCASEHSAYGLSTPEDYRLVLPITKTGPEVERINASLEDYIDPVDLASFECGMFPIDSSVEIQAAPAPHLIVADVEVLFFSQHNRRFAWGLTTHSCTIRAYVFGMDDIWASTDMDIASTEGRRALVSLLVGWSLCPVDRLGFDLSIRYSPRQGSGNPYLEIDVHEMEKSSGQVKICTYYSQRCVGAANRLTGRRVRYFAASIDLKSMDKPAFLIKDVWSTSDSGSAGDTHESSVLNILRAEFDGFTSKFGDSFTQLVNTGPVCIGQGNAFVEDTTAMAFAGLPNISQNRQHRRTVTQWVGNMVSAADDQNQVVVAVADVMAALDAAYSKCKILHGNIGDQAILLRKTADGIKGVLAEFDYASFGDDGTAEVPELMIFRSILSLENAGRCMSRLDDMESLLYLVSWLGTFGINRTERTEYAADYAARCAAGRKPHLPILSWNQGTVAQSAQHKRNHMDTAKDFEVNILSNMRHGPLRNLAKDLHKALFLHPGCSGAKKTAY